MLMINESLEINDECEMKQTDNEINEYIIK